MSETVIILGAGVPHRGSAASAMVLTSGNRRVLDWIITAFSQLNDPSFHFVGGYELAEIIQRYPSLHFSVNEKWRTTGSVSSLLTAPLVKDRTTYVCYSDVVFRNSLIADLGRAPGEVVLAVDCSWRERYPDRPLSDLRAAEKVRLEAGTVAEVNKDLPLDQAQGEFAGVVKLSPRALAFLERLSHGATDVSAWDLPRLLNWFRREGLRLGWAPANDAWAEIKQPLDLASFVFGSKAETLERLRPLARCCHISEAIFFSVDRWRTRPREVLREIAEKLGGGLLAVRSSALGEDGWESSQAGKYLSVLDVDGSSEESLRRAIAEVIGSYPDDWPNNQVLVQPMVQDVAMSGVLTTRTLTHGAPYLTISYDDTTGKTNLVTSGGEGDLRTILLTHRDVALAGERFPHLKALLRAAKEMEELVGHDALDAEFAITRDQRVHILQLRPISVKHDFRSVEDQTVFLALEEARRLFRGRQAPSPNLLGGRTFLSVMSDWNPAEMIGVRPRPLAASLYQRLITDEVWAVQRAQYGYRDVRPQKLMVMLAGHAYIDVRASFNSFIPAALPDDVAGKLVEAYLELLAERPHLHDKVEFDVAFTCYGFDFAQQAEQRLGRWLSGRELEYLGRCLLELTKAGMSRCAADMALLSEMAKRRASIVGADLEPLAKAYLLLEDCRRFGTLPFAHMARAGFVAVTLLRSLVRVAAISQDEQDAFLGGLRTVARQLETDGQRVHAGGMGWDEFVAKYGHLRPGSYDITSLCYKHDPERYLGHLVAGGPVTPPAQADPWSEAARGRVGRLLRQAGLPMGVDDFMTFLRQAIVGREAGKFTFTVNLSEALEALALYGQELGLDRQDMSYLDIEPVLRLAHESPAIPARELLGALVEQGKLAHEIAQAVEMPPLLLEEADLSAFELTQTVANYITRGTVTALVSERPQAGDALTGRVVLIPAADPGYDWLFGHHPAGLITMYGGANSHMAIRAAELNLPAAIGVGPNLYTKLAKAHCLQLDCAAGKIRVVS